MDLSTQLNNKQKQAVEASGNVMIIAGPGTGKTRTLTYKITNLLEVKRVDPEEIVALTFTKKAAAEMWERVGQLLSSRHPEGGLATEESHKTDDDQSDNPNKIIRVKDSAQDDDMLIPIRVRGVQGVLEKKAKNSTHHFLKLNSTENKPFIGTFHSLAFEILQKHGLKTKIATEKELAEIIRKICGKYSAKQNSVNIKNLVREISMHKTSEGEFSPEIRELVKEYNKELEKRDLMDYDDLLIKTSDVAKKLDLTFKHILVDEFQDTNDLQYKLIKQFLDSEGSIFVIGDPKQSIYGFRGSNEKIFEKFEKDFPNVEKFFLDINYRSGENIIKSSLALFKDATKLQTDKKEKGSVMLVETFNQYSEAQWILKEINEKVGGIDLNYAAQVDLEKQTHSFADFAVVYRTHSMNNILEKKFYESGIPFQVIGSQSLYEQKEIKFILLSLRYLAETVSMYRYIDTKKVGELLVELKNSGAVDDPSSLIKEKLEKINIQDKKVSELVNQIVEEFYLEQQLNNNPIQYQNLKEFVVSTIRFDKQEDGLVKFLQYIKYLEEHEYYDKRADKVTLMTMHAAKGLEFTFVYLIGFEEGILPYKKSIEEDNIDEEKRLLYVTMTRAEEELQILFSQKRYGKKTEISRFAENLSHVNIVSIVDPQIAKIKRKIERSRKKQLQLF